jgi:hypothetical protein
MGLRRSTNRLRLKFRIIADLQQLDLDHREVILVLAGGTLCATRFVRID